MSAAQSRSVVRRDALYGFSSLTSFSKMALSNFFLSSVSHSGSSANFSATHRIQLRIAIQIDEPPHKRKPFFHLPRIRAFLLIPFDKFVSLAD